MKAFRGAVLSVCVAAGVAWLGGCGNALTNGSDPSGSIIRVVSISPDPPGAFQPDILLSECSTDDTGKITYEPGLFVSYANVLMRNDSRPNTPAGQSTNSFVTMNRYRVDYTGSLPSGPVSIRPIDVGGLTVGIAPDGTGTMQVLVMDYARHDYILSHYPTVGTTDTLTLRATITMWGEDAFRAEVSTTAEVTLVIANYDRC